MGESNIYISLFQRKLSAPFGFGGEEIQETTSILVRTDANESIGEYPVFPGRTRLGLDEIRSQIDTNDIGKDLCSIIDYCMEQILHQEKSKLSSFLPIKICGLIDSNCVEIAPAMIQLKNAGYSSVKIKLTPSNFECVLSDLRESLSEYQGKVKIRFDSNSSFSPDTVIEATMAMEGLPIEFWEDPIPFSEPSYNYQYMTKESPFPIALDEAITSIKKGHQLLVEKACNLIVLKPSHLLEFSEIESYLEKNREIKTKIVISSLFESEIGISNLAQLSSTLGLQTFPHGLDTVKYFDKAGLKIDPTMLKLPNLADDFKKTISGLEWQRVSEYR